MKRELVYQRIDEERAYQEACRTACKWQPAEGKPPECHLVYMRQYLDRAEKAVLLSANQNRPEVLANIRKVAALAVACMEQHGCPQREMSDVHKRPDHARRIDT